jgi:hypothetical protein
VLVPLALIVFYAFTSEEGGFSIIIFRKFMMHPEALKLSIPILPVWPIKHARS